MSIGSQSSTMSQSTTQTARSRRGTLRAESMDLQQRNRRGTLRAESMDLQHCNVRDMSLVEILNAFSEAEYLELRGLFGEQLDVRLPAGEFVQLCTGLVLSKYPFLREEVLQPQAWELCRLTDASGRAPGICPVIWFRCCNYQRRCAGTGRACQLTAGLVCCPPPPPPLP